MTPHPKALEAMARRIYEDRNGHGCKPWSLLPNAHKEPYQKDAIAAHKALFDTLAAEGLSRKGEATEYEDTAEGIEAMERSIETAFPIIREVK